MTFAIFHCFRKLMRPSTMSGLPSFRNVKSKRFGEYWSNVFSFSVDRKKKEKRNEWKKMKRKKVSWDLSERCQCKAHTED